jgi:hypothetical protein
MEDEKWIETKREYSVDDLGNKVLRGCTLEKEKSSDSKNWFTKNKEPIDFILKLIGVGAIAIPLLIFARGQTADLNKQKALLQIDGYSRLFTTLNIINSSGSTKEIDSLINILNYDIYPKIELFSADSIVQKTAEIIHMLSTISDLSMYYNSLETNRYGKLENGDPFIWIPPSDTINFNFFLKFGISPVAIDSANKFLLEIHNNFLLLNNQQSDSVTGKILKDMYWLLEKRRSLWIAAINEATIRLEADCIRSNKVLYNQ